LVDWHVVEFGIPKLSSLTDEQLEGLYVDRDGRWSSAIRAAMRRFGTEKLDLDENWASRSPDWECPGCGRRKPDLVRLSSAGVLLARLDIHHDHLTDHLKSILRTKLGPQWRAAIPPDTAHLEKLGSKLVARFEPSTVCLDCNGADGAVKAKLREIPRSFSFRPSEIRRFVTARPNVEHQIDLKAAHTIFAEARLDFERRLGLVETLAAMTLAGEMTLEPGNQPSMLAGNPMGMYRHLHTWFLRECPEQHTTVSKDVEAFEARSVSRDGVATAERRKPRAIIRPTDDEIAAYDGGGAADLWQGAPPDWRCPACGRDRGDILRQSNNRKRPWAGKLVRHTEYIVTDSMPDDEDPEVSVDPFIDRHELHLICLDCSTIMAGVKSRWPDISASDALFQLSDMRAVATATPNQAHATDWAAAAERARASLPLADLAKAYWRHHNEAVSCRAIYRSFLTKCGGNKQRAWTRLSSYYADELAGLEEPEGWLDFMLSEADRIGIDDPFRLAASLAS